MLISEAYRKEQVLMHTLKAYGKSGGKWWQQVCELIDKHECRTWLDYGCGTGKLAANVRKTGLSVLIEEYDPGVVGKDVPISASFDLVTCLDVLEHIEPECLDDVLADLWRLTGKIAFVVVATRPAGKELPDGRNAHLIVQPWEWWLAKLREHFEAIDEWKDADEGRAILGPKND